MILTAKSYPRHASRAGFSLIEMIGVLAIIAILAVVIVPKVFATITSARITTAIGSVTSMKPAVADFVTKYGTLPVANGVNRLDDLLVQEGILDGRFAVKIGTQPANPALPAAAVWARNATGAWAILTAGGVQTAQTKLISILSVAAQPAVPNGSYYLLNGPAGTPLPPGSMVVSAMIVGVPAAEARDLSNRIDGDVLSQPATSVLADNAGRVTYTAGAVGAVRNVFIYVAHQ